VTFQGGEWGSGMDRAVGQLEPVAVRAIGSGRASAMDEGRAAQKL